MKIYIPNHTNGSGIGGGWSFLSNFLKGMNGKVFFVDKLEDCDICFIFSSTTADKEEINRAKELGKQIVLRVDNIPKDSRNRGTAISRMKKYAQMADIVIYQSEWAKMYAGLICGEGEVIYNGYDHRIFNKEGNKLPRNKKTVNLIVQYNRDENKRVPESFYYHHMQWRKDKDCELWIVGQFSPETVSYNFDFFDGEDITYFGVIEDKMKLAEIMRSADNLLFSAFADASPNVLTECLACGCLPIEELINPIGGTIEIWERYKQGIIPTIYDMCDEYYNIFNLLLKSLESTVGI